MKLTVAYFTLLVMTLLGACKKSDLPPTEAPLDAASKKISTGFAENDAVLLWNKNTSTVLTGAPMSPPAQSRFFAMVQIAVHDALNSIKPKYERFALTDTRDPFAATDAAVASAAYHTITLLKLERHFAVQDWYNDFLSKIPDGESKQRGIALGLAAAHAIINKRSTDNYEIARRQIALPDGIQPGEYRSTLPFSNSPNPLKLKALDQWSTLTPFVIESSTQFRVEPPYAVTSAEYAADYNEVKMKGGRALHTRTAEEDEIGRFWVERSSIGWNRFARLMIGNIKMDAWKTARLLALVHTAMADGTITNFESKYHYFYWRPETAIRMGDIDSNPATTKDAGWLPGYLEIPNPDPAMNVYTPPLPEYPSLHAAYGGAAGEVLRLFFGRDNISVDMTSLTAPDITRHYSSLSTAIRHNSLSRIYVGYHFRKAVIAGEEQGIDVANYVFHNAFREEGDE